MPYSDHDTRLLHARWNSMMFRCYGNNRRLALIRAYNDVTVCFEWQNFQNFYGWAITQPYKGNDLDKDLLVIGNKEYRPDRCLFLPKAINSLLTSEHHKDSNFPVGVWASLSTPRKPFLAVLRYKGVYQLHKKFATVDEAASAYRAAKASLLRNVAEQQTDHRIKEGLLRHANYHESFIPDA